MPFTCLTADIIIVDIIYISLYHKIYGETMSIKKYLLKIYIKFKGKTLRKFAVFFEYFFANPIAIN